LTEIFYFCNLILNHLINLTYVIKSEKMKRILKKTFYSLFTSIVFITNCFGQTNPTAQNLPFSENFSSFNGSQTTYPAGVQGWTITGSLGPSFPTAAPNANHLLAGGTNASASAGVYDMNNKMGIYCTGSSQRAICLAINTTGNSGINVSFDAGTQAQISGGRINELGLQYRVGTSGAFTNISSSTYQNNASSTINSGTSASNILNLSVPLPAACNNQSVVQLRWVIRDVSGSGNRPSFSIDNISISVQQTSTVTITAQDPNTPTAVNWALGSINNQFYRSSISPVGANATLSSVSSNMTGSYVNSDISANGFKLYYSSDLTFVPGGDVFLGQQSSTTGNGETITWSSLTQTIAQNATGYIYATADISGTANAGNTLAGSFTSTANVVFSPTVTYNGSSSFSTTTNKTFVVLPTNPTTYSTSCSSEANVNITMNAPTVGTVLVFANTTGSFTTPTGPGAGFTGNNTDYSLAANYPAVGGNLVYAGTGANFAVTGLSTNQNYSFKAYSYTGSDWSSGTAIITGSATTQPVTSTVVAAGSGSLQLSWTNPSSTACYNNVIVIARQGSPVEAALSKANFDGLVDDNDFTGANATWTSNSNSNDVFDLTSSLVGTDNTNFLVYKGTGNSVTLNGLTNGTPYYFRVFTIDGNGLDAKWGNGIDANGTPDVPGYYWNGGSIPSLPANGGSGTWGTTNAWRQPGASGAQSTWVNGNPAIFAGNAGVVTLDADITATSYLFNTSSYTLETTSSTSRNLFGPLTIGNNNALVIAPNFTGTTNGTMGFGSISGTGSASLTIYGNQIVGSAARINLASANSTISVPTNIVSASGTGGAGYVATSTGGFVNGNITNNSSLTTIIGATSGNDLTVNSTISGSGSLMFAGGASGGAGTVNLNAVNNYGGQTIFNAANSGVIKLGINNSLPVTTDVTMAFSASNGGILDLNGFNQSIGNIANGAGGGSITNNSAASNSTLTITQTTLGSFNRPITDGPTRKLTIEKNGSNTLTLIGTGYTFSGGLKINSGEMRFNPSASPVNLASCPVTLNGGSLGTSGIAVSSVLNYSTLNVADNSTISLGTANSHTLNFVVSNALSWTPSKTLTITGWQGTYTTTAGSPGTKGRIVVGTSTTALTGTQLSQIKFYDGSVYYSATLLSNGELVPGSSSLTQLSTAFCAYTSTSTSEFIWADSLGAPTTQNNYRYKFKLINGASTLTWTTNNEWPIMQFYLIPGYLPATTYTTSVAWSSDFGATFSVYGPTCTLTSPGAPSTQLSAGSCGSSPGSYSQILYANQVAGATQYEYQLINSSLSYTQSYVKTNNNFNLTQFTGLTNGTTYSVTVRANVNSVWSPYGTSCNVTTPSSLPTTSLSASNCGITAPSWSQILYANQVAGATQYEYQLINSSLSYTQSFVKTNNNFNLAQFTGLTNGTTYSVSVRVSLGAGFGSYGPVCTIMTPAITPTTSLSVSNCGITASSWSQILYANQVAGATQYEYQLINSSLSYTQSYVKTNNNFNLTQFSGLANGTTYSVSVRVNLGTGFGNYGSACNITTPSTLPTTALQPSYCSYTAPNFSTTIFATAVSGATQYEYRLINSSLSYTQSFVKTNGNFNLSLFTGLALSTTYTVQVRVFFNSAWGPYGSVCNVTTPASASPLTVNVIPYLRLANTVENESIETVFDAMVYPNPYTQQFAVNLSRYKVNESVSIRVFDATGKLIEQHSLTPNEVSNLNLGAQYPAGIYNIVVSQAGKAKSIKVVKP
jgi:hypothetical protein